MSLSYRPLVCVAGSVRARGRAPGCTPSGRLRHVSRRDATAIAAEFPAAASRASGCGTIAMPQPGAGAGRPRRRRLPTDASSFPTALLRRSSGHGCGLPLTPFVVRDHVQHDDLVGYYSGCMNAAFVAGQALASIVWVALSGLWRPAERPAFMSTADERMPARPSAPAWLLVAFIARFAQGLASGTSVVGKACVAA